MPPNRFPVPLWFPHSLLLLSVLFVLSFVLWSRNTVIDEVVRGAGKIIPAHQVQVVQNLEGGILTELLVAEGETVKANQPLLRIDATRFTAEYREIEQQILALRVRITRLDSELTKSQQIDFPSELVQKYPQLTAREQELFQARTTERDQTHASLQTQITQRRHALDELAAHQAQVARGAALARKELNITRPLVKQGVMSEVELLRLERQVNELEGEQKTLAAGIPRAEAELAEAKQKLVEWHSQVRSRLLAERNEAETTRAGLEEKNPILADRVARTTVRAPVAGTVKRIHLTTLGGVIQPGMELMTLVPTNDTLLIEAHIAPSDIAFVHPGQRAVSQFTAYDYAIYGGFPAILEHISPDSLTDNQGEAYYLARLRLDLPLHNPLHILPGMMVSVDILTGKRSVWDYLMTPISRLQQKALRER